MNAQKILYDMLSYSAPIILCVLGGNFAHSANVLNIALEGMMLVGAFVSVLVVLFTGNVWLGILVGVLATMVFGLTRDDCAPVGVATGRRGGPATVEEAARDLARRNNPHEGGRRGAAAAAAQPMSFN